MKLKQRPEDFQVEELTDVSPGGRGRYAFYQLEKKGLGTPEAIQAIARRWRIEAQRIAHGGLKDRHAVTRQYLSIAAGPRRGLKQSHFHLRYLGLIDAPYGSPQVRGNRFRIVLRDLNRRAIERYTQAVEQVRTDGVANYFDDQRFGSVGKGKEFIARKLIDGDYEAALKLSLTEPYEHDRPAQKEEKRTLREHWGKWGAVKVRLPRGHAHNIIAYLADHPSDFRGAVARLRVDLKSLYLAVYQSYLWNRLLACWIEQLSRPEQLTHVQLRLGPVPMWRHLDESQRQAVETQTIPLPSARLKVSDSDPLKPLIDSVMQEEGMELSEMKLKHFREPFFSRGERPVRFVPANLDYKVEPDEAHAERQKLALAFDLPRGSYATILVKRATEG